MALAVRFWCLLPVGRSAAWGLRLPAGAAGRRRQRVPWRLGASEVPSPPQLSAFLPQRPFSGGAFILEAPGAPRRLRVCGELRKDLGAVRLEHTRDLEGCRSSPLRKPAFLSENRGRRRSEGQGEPAPAYVSCVNTWWTVGRKLLTAVRCFSLSVMARYGDERLH